MIQFYRVLRKAYAHAPFDGEGAYRYGGRWSSPGTRLSYASEHQSLAMLEYFVHLDQDDPPSDLVLAAADVPKDVDRGARCGRRLACRLEGLSGASRARKLG